MTPRPSSTQPKSEVIPTEAKRSGGTPELAFALVVAVVSSSPLLAQSQSAQAMHFDQAWWTPLSQNERWDFIYGLTDCGPAIQSGLSMGQYENFITAHVDTQPNSVLNLIRLAPRKVRAMPPLPGGEVWKGRHSFLNGDMWGAVQGEKRAYVEGYLACEHRSVHLVAVDRYIVAMDRHFSNPKRTQDKLANVLEPLLPNKHSDQHP